MTTKLNRLGMGMLAMMLLAAAPSFAQDLFEEQAMKPPLTEEQKAAGERESVF